MDLLDDTVPFKASRPDRERCPLGCADSIPVLDLRDPIQIKDPELANHHPMERCYFRCIQCGHGWVSHHFTTYLNEYYSNDSS